jgi:hypothetical protein
VGLVASVQWSNVLAVVKGDLLGGCASAHPPEWCDMEGWSWRVAYGNSQGRWWKWLAAWQQQPA